MGWVASEASGGGVLPSEARLPPGGLASSRRRRRIASEFIFDHVHTTYKYRNIRKQVYSQDLKLNSSIIVFSHHLRVQNISKRLKPFGNDDNKNYLLIKILKIKLIRIIHE